MKGYYYAAVQKLNELKVVPPADRLIYMWPTDGWRYVTMLTEESWGTDKQCFGFCWPQLFRGSAAASNVTCFHIGELHWVPLNFSLVSISDWLDSELRFIGDVYARNLWDPGLPHPVFGLQLGTVVSTYTTGWAIFRQYVTTIPGWTSVTYPANEHWFGWQM